MKERPPEDPLEIQCPFCGEILELTLEADLSGRLVQDCEICCNPIQLDIKRDAWGDAEVCVERAD